MKKLFTFFVACFAMFMVSCGSFTQGSPVAAAAMLAESMKVSDVAGVDDLAWVEGMSADDAATVKAGLVSMVEQMMKANGGVTDYTIDTYTLDESGEMAEVITTYVFADGNTVTSALPLQKGSDGLWYIVL